MFPLGTATCTATSGHRRLKRMMLLDALGRHDLNRILLRQNTNLFNDRPGLQ